MTTAPRFMLSTTVDHDSWSTGPTLRVQLHPVYLNEDGDVRNPSFSSYSDDTLGHLDGFQISASYCADLGWYGYAADYRQLYGVDLARAESMVKLLRKLNRKLEAAERAYGYAPDFPTYCVRVAEGVGAQLDCETFGLDAPRGGLWGSGDRYRWTGVQALRDRLNDLTGQLTAQH